MICRHCGRKIVPGFVDYSDTRGWVHSDNDDALCSDAEDSPQAEPMPSTPDTYEFVERPGRFYLCIKWPDGWHVRASYRTLDSALYNAEPVNVDAYPTCITEL